MQLTNTIIDTTNQTTKITKINQISSKENNFDKLVEDKEKLSSEEKKKLGVKEQINKFFGESSFSNALYDELTKGINDTTSNEKLVSIVEKLIVIDLYINNTLQVQ